MRTTSLLFVVLTAWCSMALAQGSPKPPDPHPKKAIYADAATWPATAPGSVSLANFEPFRAVYDRRYNQHGGPNAGDPRRDRIIITAEEVAWDGRKALAITLLDSGIVGQADTNARSLTQVSDLASLEVLFEMGPLPGKAKDYYLARVESEALLLNMVMTEEQSLTPQKMEVSAPGFGPGTWVMAAMKLEPGAKINLAPYYSPQGTNVVSASSYARVLGRETFVDGKGGKIPAWVVETGGYHSPSNPKVQHIYLIDRPPYYLGTETVNLDTGEKTRFVWLRHVQSFAE